MRRYEGMFLFDNTAVHEWSEMEAEVKRLFERIEAEPLVCVKFDERRLAYDIKGRKRGTYVLTYFNADPQRIAAMERDAQLSELILRLLVLQAEKLSDARLAELKAHTPDQPLQPISSEGRRGDHGPRTRADHSAAGKAKTPGAESEKSQEQQGSAADGKQQAETATAVAEEPAAAAAAESAPQPESQAAPETPPAAETPGDKPPGD